MKISKQITPIFLLFFFSLTAVKAEILTIVGSGDGVYVLQEIAKQYTNSHPGNEIIIPESVGSSGGIKLVGKGQYKLGRVARKLNNNEENYHLRYLPYARIPVTFYVNQSVSINNITINQILDIYRGNITNWSEIGGIPLKIRVVRRELGESSTVTLGKAIPAFQSLQFTEFSKVATSEKQSVSLVATVEGAIGFGPLPAIDSPSVKILMLEGKAPQDSHYPLETVLGFVYHDSDYTGVLAQFLTFATSKEVSNIIISAQALPY